MSRKAVARRAMSNLVSSLLLISIAIGSGVIVYSAFNGLAAPSNPLSVSLQINGGWLIQGTNEATLNVELVNLGSQPTTSLTLGLSGVQSSSSSFSATVTLTSLPSGSQVYSGSFTVSPGSPTVSYSFNAALAPNQNTNVAVTFVPSTLGGTLFATGGTYGLVVSTQPYSQASVLLTAEAP